MLSKLQMSILDGLNDKEREMVAEIISPMLIDIVNEVLNDSEVQNAISYQIMQEQQQELSLEL